jgi:hypothetical protein
MRQISLVLLVLMLPAAAAELTVTKGVMDDQVEAGETIEVYLDFNNAYDEDIVVSIVDENTIDGSGVIIECLEALVPAGRESRIPYTPITAYSTGNFTLGSAEVSYTEPGGATKSISSGEVEVHVTGDAIQGTRSVTKTYRCGGVQRESTSIVSSGMSGNSMTFNLGTPSRQQMPKAPAQQVSPLYDMIKRDEGYQKLSDELVSRGYVLQDRNLRELGNDSGLFNYVFRNGDDEIKLFGEVVDGAVVSIGSAEEENPMLIFILIIIASAALLAGAYIFSYRKPKKQEPIRPKPKASFKHILKTEDPDKLSDEVRRYALHLLGKRQQMTNSMMIRELQEKKGAMPVIRSLEMLSEARYTGGKVDVKKIHEEMKKVL